MSTSARVVALGQMAGGDDGVGLAVLDEIRRRPRPPGLTLYAARDAIALFPLLDDPAPIVIVDAAAGTTPGRVLELAPEDLGQSGVRPVSSHGLGLAEVLAIAGAASPPRGLPAIRIVAVAIASPVQRGHGLSPAVAAAVRQAADLALAAAGAA